nr:MAG TPA: hypothetical protein [Caudoviricetes sp.]
MLSNLKERLARAFLFHARISYPIMEKKLF